MAGLLGELDPKCQRQLGLWRDNTNLSYSRQRGSGASPPHHLTTLTYIYRVGTRISLRVPIHMRSSHSNVFVFDIHLMETGG